MAFCTRCGAPLKDGQKFCTECGAPNAALTVSAAPETLLNGQPLSAAPQKKKRSGWLIALIVAGCLLLTALPVALLFGLLHARGRGAELPEPTIPASIVPTIELPEAPQAYRDGIAGHYALVRFSFGETEYDRAGLEEAGYADSGIDFLADGSGSLLLPDEEALPFRYSEETLYFDAGDSAAYTWSEGEIHISLEELTMSFTADGSAPQTTPRPDPKLHLGTDWHGTLTISAHSGSGSLADGTQEVWGYLGEDSEGRAFFELYDKEYDDDANTLLSFYLELYDDHFVPVIGEDDAWFFDIQLDERDVAPFTLYYRDGVLALSSYAYSLEGEFCRISFSVSPC